MFRKMVPFFFLLCSHLAFSEAPISKAEIDHYDVAIGLGGYCQVARAMHYNGIRYHAYPFDWLFSPFDSVFEFIAKRGVHFLDKDTLVFVTGKPDYLGGHRDHILDTVYGLQLLHDFEASPNFLKDYDSMKAKYERRVARFFAALDSKEKILFIRHGITYMQAVLLDQLLHTRYPQLSYTILAVDNTEEMKRDWGLQRVKNVYLRQTEPWVWWGDDAAWKEVLRHYSVTPQQSLTPRHEFD